MKTFFEALEILGFFGVVFVSPYYWAAILAGAIFRRLFNKESEEPKESKGYES